MNNLLDETKAIRSTECTTRSFITFENKTPRSVNLYWVNYTSVFIHYKTLLPNEVTNVDTYQTHPWIIKDSDTGERLLIRKSFLYYPPPWYRNLNTTTGRIQREKASITSPMRSLRLNTMWKIIGMVREPVELDDLELPKTLIHEILFLYNNSKTNTFK